MLRCCFDIHISINIKDQIYGIYPTIVVYQTEYIYPEALTKLLETNHT